ncbi:MAG: hypothetical protein WCJ30_13845, partial [Deltaproteobacteria bacterium]
MNPARCTSVVALLALVATACSTAGPAGDASLDHAATDALAGDSSDVHAADAPISDSATVDG